ncbi:hypothetical protein BDV26DRAFT_274820 [Aspergillus bertholletiae]|uniref:Uncharacterized protein n=1 Tax=Aspergillus bertholletiae TaxID=1226010 RepID=A0A5N7AQC9_9EURO|nr:hypothetical protein BDV26DRAFT_274820 [Aspergillus bertholletiae]
MTVLLNGTDYLNFVLSLFLSFFFFWAQVNENAWFSSIQPPYIAEYVQLPTLHT